MLLSVVFPDNLRNQRAQKCLINIKYNLITAPPCRVIFVWTEFVEICLKKKESKNDNYKHNHSGVIIFTPIASSSH